MRPAPSEHRPETDSWHPAMRTLLVEGDLLIAKAVRDSQ
jgi:hypothetical protein